MQIRVLVGEFSTPFDEFEDASRSETALRPGKVTLWLQGGLRLLSFASLWVAILTASFLIFGKPGTGKTHLDLAIGYAACFQRKRVRFTKVSALVAKLIDNYENRRIRRFYRRLDRLDLLIVDEIGYVRFSELGTQLFFVPLRTTYERLGLVLTTTIPPEKWGEVFESESPLRRLPRIV